MDASASSYSHEQRLRPTESLCPNAQERWLDVPIGSIRRVDQTFSIPPGGGSRHTLPIAQVV